MHGNRNSEVIDVDAKHNILYRDGNALYRFGLGADLNRSLDLIVKDDGVENIHWSFYR